MNLHAKRAKELAQLFFETVRKEGLAPTVRRAAGFARRRLRTKKGRFLPPEAVLAAQRAADTAGWPVVSICVPLYNTPLPFLREMVASVLGQTCPNWQLCLADASDAQHAQVGEYVQGLGEGRIRYVLSLIPI